MVDCASDQGRSIFKNACVMGLRRVFQKRENADMWHKMPFMDGQSLSPMLAPGLVIDIAIQERYSD